MDDTNALRLLADNLWMQHFPLRLLGTEQGRVVTVIRLRSGDLILHSSAPFTAADVQAIRGLGRPRWLVEGMLLHDTFTKQGLAALPEVALLAPPGFSEVVKLPAAELLPAPPEWSEEVEVLALEGVPMIKEHLLLHRPSRTLIVSDLVFNYDYRGHPWERFFRRFIAGLKVQPGMTRIFRLLIRDREAFQRSMAKVMEWDFDRIIVGHMEVVPSDGKALLRRALQSRGL